MWGGHDPLQYDALSNTGDLWFCFSSSYLLAFANTTKPLQHRNGLVVLANANKSAVPRVHGWPGKRLFLALYDLPHTHTPSPKSATLANHKYCAWKYYAKSCLYRGSAGNETQSRESNPRPHC